MDKFLLSIFVGSGSFLVGNGYSTMSFLPPLLSINIGGILLLIAVLYAYLSWKQTVWKELYVYLSTLYEDVGLFVKQYYNSDSLHNGQTSSSIQEKMKEFTPLLSQNEPLMPKSVKIKTEAFFDKLFDYTRRVDGEVSYNRDDAAYKRWLVISVNFDKDVVPEFKKIKRLLKK